MGELVRNGKFDVLVGHYAHPGGDPAFIRALVCFLNERCGWNLKPGEAPPLPPGAIRATKMIVPTAPAK